MIRTAIKEEGFALEIEPMELPECSCMKHSRWAGWKIYASRFGWVTLSGEDGIWFRSDRDFERFGELRDGQFLPMPETIGLIRAGDEAGWLGDGVWEQLRYFQGFQLAQVNRILKGHTLYTFREVRVKGMGWVTVRAFDSHSKGIEIRVVPLDSR